MYTTVVISQIATFLASYIATGTIPTVKNVHHNLQLSEEQFQ